MSRRLVLVRHGEPERAWPAAADPGLSERGRAQAEALADELAALGPRPIVVSPRLRTRQTAAPLERRWGVTARVEPAVGEVPVPAGIEEPQSWLVGLLSSPIEQWDGETAAWAAELRAALGRLEDDAVVFTHYVAIRVATGSDACHPAHCSQTVVEVG